MCKRLLARLEIFTLQGIPDMFGFPQGKRRSWRGKVNEDDLRGATRYPLLPAEQNRLAVWWNGRYSAFSKVDKSSNANTPLLPFFKLNDALLVCCIQLFFMHA